MRNGTRALIVLVLCMMAACIGSWPVCAKQLTIKINGVTGQVIESLDVARPGDQVKVEVCPADLINYEYTIEKTEVKLSEGFSIVGVGTVFEPTSGVGTVPTGKAPEPKGLAAVPEDDVGKELLKDFRSLREKIGNERKQVVQALEPVVKASTGQLFAGATNCQPWPTEIQTLAGNGVSDPPFFSTYDTRVEGLNELEAERQGLLARIKDIQLVNLLAGKEKSTTFLDALQQEIEAIQGEISSLKRDLDSARTLVDRWAKILGHHGEPKLTETFLMPQASTRFTIGVKRKPITPESRNELPVGTEVAKIESSLIATTTFENRALHRFNVSLGMAGAWRENSRDFEVAPSFGSDGNVAFHVREVKQDELETEAAAFLGIYLGAAVDNFNPERKPAFMLMLGSDISSSPSDFFLGVGLDTPLGVVVGIGLTEYEGISLADGWRVNQEVLQGTGDQAGKPKVATIPKQKDDALGAYVMLGFRPSIFKAFLDRRKP